MKDSWGTRPSQQTLVTDAGGLFEDHDTGAMAMTVPGTQQSPGCHPPRPQCVAGLLMQVLRVVIHSHVVAHIPAKNPALQSATMNSTIGHALSIINIHFDSWTCAV